MIIALILVLLLALAYGALQGLLGHGPFRFLNTMYLKSLPGNAEIYRPENVAPVENSPLSGMNLCFLGSSVTELIHLGMLKAIMQNPLRIMQQSLQKRLILQCLMRQ